MINFDSTIVKALSKFNIKKNSIIVFTLLLKVGPQPVSFISKKLKIKRTTCYGYLAQLKKEGFIHEEIRGKIKFFIPIKFSFLLDSLEEKIHIEFEETKNKLTHLREIEKYIKKY